MSMFSGPLARLRAQSLANNPDATPTIMDESNDPMTVAPAALGNTLRQKVGLDDPVMSAFNRYREAFAPAKAPPVEVPQGNKVMDLRNLAAKRRQQLVQQITQYQPGDPRRQALLAQRAALEQEDSALSSIGSADRSADILARQEQTDGTQMNPEAYKVHESTIARAVEPRERLRQILQQRKDDELNAQRQRDAEAGLVADTRALEWAMGVAKLEQMRLAMKNAKTEAEVREIQRNFLPQQLQTNIDAAKGQNERQNKLADLQMQSAQLDLDNKRAANDPELLADEKELRRLDVQAKLTQARAANDIEGKSISYEKALADPEYKDLAETTSVLTAQLIADGNNENGAESLMSSVRRLNKYLASMPPADAKRLAESIRTQLARNGVKKFDTNFFTNSASYFNPFRAFQHETQKKSQQAVKALEYVLSRAGEPAQ